MVDITKRKVLELKNAQQAKIIEQIHDCIVSTDLNGIIVNWNEGAQDLLEYKASEIIGKHITFLYQEQRL